MRFSYTDGTIVDIPDQCAHCQLDTAGNHQSWCPLYWSDYTEIVPNVAVTFLPSRESFNQTLKRIITKHRGTLDRLS